MGLQVRFTNAENGTYFVGSGLGETNTVKTQEGLPGLDLEEINFGCHVNWSNYQKRWKPFPVRIVIKNDKKGLLFEN